MIHASIHAPSAPNRMNLFSWSRTPFTRIAALTFAAGALAMAPGCASRKDSARFEPASAIRISALSGSDLRLTKLLVDGNPVETADYPITLRFADGGKVSGRSAVNRYFGSFELNKEGEIIWPKGGLGMTRMAGPASAMDLESQFSKALTATTRLMTSPDSARFESSDGKQALEFQR